MRSTFRLLPLLFASALQAQIILGPESFVCQPRFSDAQVWDAAAVATNGRETLAVVQTRLGALYLQRLGEGAQPLTEHGVPIVRDVWIFDIASDGDGFVVVWIIDGTARSLHISAGGEVSPPQVIGDALWSLQIASNGDGYLVAWTTPSAYPQQAMARRLDSAGKPIGDPFPLTGSRSEARVLALASDGRDYLAAIDHFNPPDRKTTLVPVTGAGVAGPNIDLRYRLMALKHTVTGYVGLWSEQFQGSFAVPVDPSGHMGLVSMINVNPFVVASSNGNDVLAIDLPYHRVATATRIRRNGDAIETLAITGLMTQPDAFVIPGALHTGDYFTITVNGPVGVATVPAPERPLLIFPIRQESPAISGNVVAWREGSLLRAARAGVERGRPGHRRLRRPTLLSEWPSLRDPLRIHRPTSYGTRGGERWTAHADRLDRVPSEHVRQTDAVGAQGPDPCRGRHALTVIHDRGQRSVRVRHRSTPLLRLRRRTAAFSSPGSRLGVSHIAKIDPSGNERGKTTFVVASDLALAPRRDGVLVLYRVDSGMLAAAPFRADLTAAGAPQVLAEKVEAPDLATDGNGHFLAVFKNDKGLWSQTLDENGVPTGSAQLLGPGARAHVAWNGSIFAIVSDANMALVAADGRVLMPLMATLPAGTQTVISGNTVATLHRTIDTGLGDENVVFVRRFSLAPPRHRATRP